ncbi:unnamed protein product [Paramecium octaurelia]|uniref:Uncharacterized protein n=1 Tax=Paramecium octaurelia TaxID=43137 RepID=A0A8S1XQI2_PAROT|nr:unnamed protein product [Paramecium octaurelia]
MSRLRQPTVHNDLSLNKEPIETVYSIANRYRTDWGLKEMPDLKIYPDVCKVKRLISFKTEHNFSQTKTFIEELQEYHSKLPGPKYEYQSFWSEPKVQKKTKEQSKYIEQNQRKNIISDIITVEKRHPRPGPADYNKEFKSKSIENEPIISQSLKLQQRTNYFEDLISQQINFPGPGAYNIPQRVVSDMLSKKQNLISITHRTITTTSLLIKNSKHNQLENVLKTQKKQQQQAWSRSWLIRLELRLDVKSQQSSIVFHLL